MAKHEQLMADVLPGAVFMHWKHGDRYMIEAVAESQDSSKTCPRIAIVYRRLGDKTLYFRGPTDFFRIVDKAKKLRRFTHHTQLA